MRRVRLSLRLQEQLVSMPEDGMGYQIVTLVLANGDLLVDETVLNCEYILVDRHSTIETEDIIDIL